MSDPPPPLPGALEAFLAGNELGLAAYQRVHGLLERIGPVDVRISKSQITFRRHRGFAYLWQPRQYLGDRGAEVVLAIALSRHDRSPRWKQVAHSSPRVWMHHLELQAVTDIDDEVAAWLEEAAES